MNESRILLPNTEKLAIALSTQLAMALKTLTAVSFSQLKDNLAVASPTSKAEDSMILVL